MIKTIATRTALLGSNLQNISRFATAVGIEKTLPTKKPDFLIRLGYKLGLINLRYNPANLDMSGKKMLAICAEYPDVGEWSETLNLPDTFHTWYNITLLHIWLLFIRLRSEGSEGHLLREIVVKVLWDDLNSRMRAFKIMRKRHVQILHSKVLMSGSMLAYDEGILRNSDSALAAAIWRNFFYAKDDVTAQELAIVVDYVRKNIQHLMDQTQEDLIGRGELSFLPLGINAPFDPNMARQRIKYSTTWPDWSHQ
ncbi:hypothetical protein Ciccas_009728 [Cichlidogyrus casuarinus]|uniref:Ubiquinol-cytochrome c chaperone domain-containing protein n=1 Tax=Cichlidogyrus casuarinus TaxID=1844966 RepID=A0ABD2PXP2_9PLAT